MHASSGNLKSEKLHFWRKISVKVDILELTIEKYTNSHVY